MLPTRVSVVVTFFCVWAALCVETRLMAQSSAQPPIPEEAMRSGEAASGVDVSASANGTAGINRGPRVRQLGNTPDDVGYQLQESDIRYDAIFSQGPLTPWHEAWNGLNTCLESATGLDLGFNYTSLYQLADQANGNNDAAGGDLDLFGDWRLAGTDAQMPGDLVFNAETRHRYGDIPPSELGGRVGSLWGTTVGFSDQKFALNELYWDQGSFEDGFRYRIGREDPALIYDGYRYASDNYAFLSPAFSDTLPMPLPGPGFGAAVAIYPHDEFYVVAGIHDANGSKSRSGFDTFFGVGEYFTAVEFGFTPNFGQPEEGLYHVTFWHIDPRSRMDQPNDHGIALTLEQQFGDEGRFVPFFRYAYAHRGLNRVRQNLSCGIGLEEPFGQNADLIGFALSWGQPSDDNLRDQYTLETFYRVMLTPHTHLTPGVQVILAPSHAPQRDAVVVFGLRARTLF